MLAYPNKFQCKQKGTVSLLLIVVILAVLGIGGYFVLVKNPPNQPAPTNTQNQNELKLKTYQDDKRDFSVSYPEGWIVNEIIGSKPADPNKPNGKSVEFRPAGKRYVPLFIVSKIDKSDKWNPQDFKKEMAKPGGELSQKESTITINGVSGWNLSAVTKNFNSVDYFQLSSSLLSTNNQTYYQIDIWDARDYPNQKILNDMLNSFKILSKSSLTGTAKGVVGISNPKPGQKITSPLTVTGISYVKKGKLTITLKQKGSGSVVTEPKTVQINGASDNIQFAQAIQFGLPVKPQTGILEIDFKDETGKGADDKVAIEVEFPSDLGKGT